MNLLDIPFYQMATRRIDRWPITVSSQRLKDSHCRDFVQILVNHRHVKTAVGKFFARILYLFEYISLNFIGIYILNVLKLSNSNIENLSARHLFTLNWDPSKQQTRTSPAWAQLKTKPSSSIDLIFQLQLKYEGKMTNPVRGQEYHFIWCNLVVLLD